MVIDPVCFLFWSLLLLVLPLQWLAAAFFSGAIHELCHMLALLAFGKPPKNIRIGIWGAKMDISGLSYRQEFLAALAGPTGSFALLLCARVYPQLAVCGAVQGVFNLLPLYPLDGGRMVRCAALMFLEPDGADRLCRRVSRAVLGCILILGLLSPLRRYVAVALGWTAIRPLFSKIPCNGRQFAVQ